MSPRTAPVLVTVLVTALATALSVLATAPAQARTPERTYESSASTATNNARVTRNRAKLKGNACIQRFAVRQARRMAARERMFHQDLGPVLRSCGLTRVGENVAYGFPSGRSVVTRGWMRSAGHRRNILDQQYTVLGIGARRSKSGTWYAAQVFGRQG